MENIINKFYELQDLKFADFSFKLIPNIERNSIIGVRSPQIKKIAKQFSKEPEKYIFLNELPHKYFEENYLHGILLGTIDKDINVVLNNVEKFLPYIDNWATCDCTVSALKIFKKFPDEVYQKVNEWIKSTKPFIQRFAIVTLLAYFLDENYKDEILSKLSKIESDEYYVKIAIAWFYSIALIKQYDQTVELVESKTLDKWIHNKSIQKAVESYRISDEKKIYLKTLKVK